MLLNVHVKRLTQFAWLERIIAAMACLAEPTLGYRRRSVRALGQLVGLQARHGRRGETTGNEVVKRHQLTGSCLLPPAGSSVAKPNLREEPRQKRLFNHLLISKKKN